MTDMEGVVGGPRILKACDLCKARKVRCTGAPGPCTRCLNRKTECHFSRMRLPRRQKVATEFLTVSHPLPSAMTPEPIKPSQDVINALPELLVDRLLENSIHKDPLGGHDRSIAFKGNGFFGGNYSLTFFSASRLASLSARLKNNKVNELVQRISTVIAGRVKPQEPVSTGSLSRKRDILEAFTDEDSASRWIKLYFQRVHPIYPFLDQKTFEATVRSRDFPDLLRRNKPWSALYHSVLALGCQYDGGGSFEPGKGTAWRLFSTSLALFPDLLTLADSLILLQAMTAMSVYAFGISCISIEHVIISEAARRAQRLGSTNLMDAAYYTFQKTFWILYSMEKISSFYFGRSSVFVDTDISCPIPSVPESTIGGFDWFLSLARHARLLSKALTHLFSVGVTGSSRTYFSATIQQLNCELESWKMSIPVEIRPGTTLRLHMLQESTFRPVGLWTHYLYNSFSLVLSRATIHLASSCEGVVSQKQQTETKRVIMDSSKSILELTTFIDVEPFAPLWVVAGMPITALFVLFDLVVHNPRHPEIWSNLALLDVAGGHFSRLQYASGGALPGSLITEFAYIAREYVNNVHRQAPGDRARDRAVQPSSLGSPLFPVVKLDQPQQPQGSSASAENSLNALQPISEIMNTTSNGTPMQMDTLDFPTIDSSNIVGDGFLMGTDIMDLFNYFIPSIDPVFYQGTMDENGVPEAEN